jgi:hypothetical protein
MGLRLGPKDKMAGRLKLKEKLRIIKGFLLSVIYTHRSRGEDVYKYIESNKPVLYFYKRYFIWFYLPQYNVVFFAHCMTLDAYPHDL